MKMNDPAVLAEARAEFDRYEAALVSNDVSALDAFFLDAESSIRFGSGENLYGYKQIQAFRAARSPVGLMRRLEETVITTWGEACAVASTLFRRDESPGKVGRQMQTWIKFPFGWRIVAAHVSIIDDPDREQI